ncbi:MAG: right-handed parallel beta-helix repeat-containing protein [Actinobacteria bacterium]|nr:right-handed parallel beta-helix repeat-containing protein [Actinomycetota bacterium]
MRTPAGHRRVGARMLSLLAGVVLALVVPVSAGAQVNDEGREPQNGFTRNPLITLFPPDTTTTTMRTTTTSTTSSTTTTTSPSSTSTSTTAKSGSPPPTTSRPSRPPRDTSPSPTSPVDLRPALPPAPAPAPAAGPTGTPPGPPIPALPSRPTDRPVGPSRSEDAAPRSQQEQGGDLCTIESAEPPARPAPSGRARIDNFSPFRVVKYPCPRDPEVRSVLLGVDRIELTQGGQLVRTIPFAAAGRSVPFEAVARAVDDPAWINEVEPGLFELAGAFVQDPGTAVTVAAPRVTTLRLLSREGVFFGGRGANARFEGVSVTSWDAQRGAPDEEPTDGRPFVLFQEGSRLDVVGSEMSFLGSDRGSAYGVTWRLGGSTGEVVDSTFAHNFFGVYTFEARDLAFRGNVFRDNILYGFDPHDATTGLLVEDNEAFGNGSHGFIVSRFVVDGVFRRNRAHDNAGNGIVMDFRSDRNMIEANLVENNAGDGIVLLGSGQNTVVDNVVRGNRVGVRVNNLDSNANKVHRNRIEGNKIGLQAYGGAGDLLVTDNVVLDSADTGMMIDAPRSVVRGGEVRGAIRGVDVRTASTLSDLRISEVDHGVVVASTGIAELVRLDVNARLESLRVETGGMVTVSDSRLFPAPPDLGSSEGVPWLPLAGVAAVLIGVMLELLRSRRERRGLPSPATARIWNRA